MTDVIVQGKDVIVEVQQPTIPPAAPPPKIGLVEINQVVARGTAWMTGNGPPTAAGGQYGDMYLDATTGDMYQWDGTAWQYIGTFAPSTDTPAEVLAKIITVDGAGSSLDADLLDGHDSPYFATQTDMTAVQAKNTSQDTQISGNTSSIATNTSAIADLQTATTPANLLTSIKTVDGSGSGLDADTLDGHDTAYFGTAAGEATLQANINLKANIASPVFTGDPQAPTPAVSDNDTSIATTAYVQSQAYLKDAPSDGNQYARFNAGWAKVVAGGGGGATGASEYTFSTTATAPPAAGQVRFDNAAQTSATRVWIAYTTAPGVDAKQLLLYSYKQGKDLYIQDKDDSSKWIVFTLTSNGTDLTTYGEWTVTHKANSGVPLTNNQRVMLSAISASAAGTVISDTVPSNPVVGTLWWKSDLGALYVYYDDGNTKQFVEAAAPAVPAAAYVQKTARRSNLVINGALNVSQENGNTEGTTDAYYAADQIYGRMAVASAAYGFARIANANLSGSQYRLRYRVTTAKASLVANDIAGVITRLEGQNVQDLGWSNIASQKDAVLSFGFNGPAGTYSIAVRNTPPSTHSFVASFTISAGQANTDTVQVIKVPAPGALVTWSVDNTPSIGLYVVLASGSTYLAPAGWNSGNFAGVTGMSNGLAAVQSFKIWDIYFGADPDKTGVPPVFEVPDYQTELAKCMRYWQKAQQQMQLYLPAGQQAQSLYALPVIMRVAPSYAVITAGSGVNASAVDISPSTLNVNQLLTATAAGITAWYGRMYALNARM